MGLILRCSIPVTEGDKTHICIVAIKHKMMGFIHMIEFTLSTSCHLASDVTPFFMNLILEMFAG